MNMCALKCRGGRKVHSIPSPDVYRDDEAGGYAPAVRTL
jgi:hypothetical protein